MKNENCPICNSTETNIFIKSPLSISITSDWKPIDKSFSILNCLSCGHLFKPLNFILEVSNYENYSAWDNDPTRDKISFEGSDYPKSRSEIIKNYLDELGLLDTEFRLLDFGCNRGSFLSLFLNNNNAGFDVTLSCRKIIESLGHKFYSPETPPPNETFNLLTLIHVLEHLNFPLRDMSLGLNSLKKSNAFIFIQIPNLLNHVFDFFIADHRHHYSSNTVLSLFDKFGFSLSLPQVNLISNEQSFLFKHKKLGEVDPVFKGFSLDELNLIKIKFNETINILQELNSSLDKYIIYGAGIIGSLICNFVPDKILYLVDDNSYSQNSSFFDKMVFSPEVLKENQSLNIIMAIPDPMGQKIKKKLIKNGHRVLCPFSR